MIIEFLKPLFGSSPNSILEQPKPSIKPLNTVSTPRDVQIEKYESVLKTMFELFDYKNASHELGIDKKLFEEVEKEIN